MKSNNNSEVPHATGTLHSNSEDTGISSNNDYTEDTARSQSLCSICGQPINVKDIYDDNNAQPINDGRCCGVCNATVVFPARIIYQGLINARLADIKRNKIRKWMEGISHE